MGYLADYNGQEISNYTDRLGGGYLIRTYNFYTPIDIEAFPYGEENKFLGYYNSNGDLIDKSASMDASDMGLIFEPGQHIYASFSGQPKPNDAKDKVTIKLYANRANGTIGGHGKVGFSQNDISYIEQNIVVNYGEKITVYAQGDEFQVDDYNTSYYYCVGFYSESNNALKTFTDDNALHSYTFTATHDIEISAGWTKR